MSNGNVVADFYQALERQRALLDPTSQITLLQRIGEQGVLPVEELLRSSGSSVIVLGEAVKGLKGLGLIDSALESERGETLTLTDRGREILAGVLVS